MSEFVPEISEDFLSPEDYLYENELFAPFDWQSGKLSAGMVLRLWHDEKPQISVFECTDLTTSKHVTGLLTEFEGSSTGLLRQPAEARLLHPIPFLARPNTPYVEFSFKSNDGRTSTTIHPIFTHAESYLSEELREEIMRQVQIEEDKRRASEVTLGQAAALLFERAGSTRDKLLAERYRTAGQIITEEFLD